MTCRCGHDAEAHEHYRRGTDCSRCDCPRFRPARRRDRLIPEPCGCLTCQTYDEE